MCGAVTQSALQSKYEPALARAILQVRSNVVGGVTLLLCDHNRSAHLMFFAMCSMYLRASHWCVLGVVAGPSRGLPASRGPLLPLSSTNQGPPWLQARW